MTGIKVMCYYCFDPHPKFCIRECKACRKEVCLKCIDRNNLICQRCLKRIERVRKWEEKVNKKGFFSWLKSFFW